MGKPDRDAQDEFSPHTIEGITLWQSVHVVSDNESVGIKIGLTQFLFFKSLSIGGAQVSTNCDT